MRTWLRARSPLPVEGCLLMALAMPNPSAEARAAGDELLKGPIDWARFVRFALRHALAPRIGRRLAKDSRVPLAIAAGFARLHAANARRNERALAELIAIVSQFREAGIGVLTFKGPELEFDLYCDVSQRIIGDLDLLVHERDVARAHAILCRRGYRLTRPFKLTQVDDGYFRPTDRQYLELHRRVALPTLRFRLADEPLIGRRGRPCRVAVCRRCRPRRFCSTSPFTAERMAGTGSRGWST